MESSLARSWGQAAVFGCLLLCLTLGSVTEGAPPVEVTNYRDGKVLPDVNPSKLDNAVDILRKILPGEVLGDTMEDRSKPTTGIKLTILDALSDKPSEHSDGCYKVENQVQCSGINVTSIPDDLGPGTTYISFVSTGLTELPNEAFLNYPDLETIVVALSPLQKIEARAFYGLSNLRVIGLGYNDNKNITFENNTFVGVSSLESLQLTGLNLQEIPKYLLEKATSLKTIDLTFNKITNIGQELLSTLDSVNELDMSSNMIDSIPPSAFNQLPNISSLILASNSLKSFDVEVIAQLKNLSHLDISNNQISNFNGSSTTKWVKKLDLSNNDIQYLAAQTFVGMTELADLRIGDNNLQSIPSSAFENIPGLKALNISGNNIRMIGKDDLGALKNLEMLNAKGMKNPLTIEDGAFKQNLLFLDLSHNDGINVSLHTLLSPTYIQNITLSHCGMKTLDGDPFMNKTSLKKLDISDNPFHCDCHVTWMPEARQTGKSWALDWLWTRTPPPECMTPSWMPFPGVDISRFSKDDLTCDKPVIKALTPTNITVYGDSTFEMKASMTKGYPYSTWIYPDGHRVRPRFDASPLKMDSEVGDSVDKVNHIVTTTATILGGFNYTEPVAFTLFGSNVMGDSDTNITFWVTPESPTTGPPTTPNGAGAGPVFDTLCFVFVLIPTLLLRD